jgi:hypothetical protein
MFVETYETRIGPHSVSESERLSRIDEWDGAAQMTPHGKPIELRKRA